MKKIKVFLGIALILLTVSGCGPKPEPAPDNASPKGEAAAKADEANKTETAGTSFAAVSDEKSRSLHSGDLFAKSGDLLIYAGGPSNIYLVNTATKENRLLVKCDRPQKLYFDGTYVYYMPYYQMGRGIYRASLTGEVEKICENSSIQLWLTDDKIYFTDQIGFDSINGTPQGNLCSMDKDGSHIKVLIKNVKNYFTIQDERIYYTDLNSRGLYQAKLDGSDRRLLAPGRTYIYTFADGYGVYVDYAAGETFHLINAQTEEDTVLGQFGLCRRLNGKTYVVTREKGANGVPSMTEWSILQINQETGKAEKLSSLNMSDVGIDLMQYVYDGWVYLYSTGVSNRQGKGTYRVKLASDVFEAERVADQYLYYLDGCGFFINKDQDGEQTGFSRIELTSKEITTWPLQ
ncbi:MAG: DUF5050 domain-containing protein [Syntrophomonadaceae bacterium]